MSRDYRKLRVFVLADTLVVQIYQSTEDFPLAERFENSQCAPLTSDYTELVSGLQALMRSLSKLSHSKSQA